MLIRKKCNQTCLKNPSKSKKKACQNYDIRKEHAFMFLNACSLNFKDELKYSIIVSIYVRFSSLTRYSVRASHVTSHMSFLKVLWSTAGSITVECTWQPRSFGSWARANAACSLVAAVAESAISTSSV